MKHPLVAKTEQGRRVYGTLVTSTSPHTPQALSSLGLDFVFIDTEHISIGRETVSWMCRTFSALGIPPIVRIPSPDPYMATSVLDAGAEGILAPYIETVEQVRALCGAVKHRPLKGDRLRRILEGEKPSDSTAAYLRTYSRDRLVLINVESTPALQRLDELVSVPGLDGVVVGPHDLSVSLDVPESYRSPTFLDTLRTIAERSRKRLPLAGFHFMDAGETDDAVGWTSLGYNFVILHADLVYFRRGLGRDLAALRSHFGDSAAGPAGALHV